MPTSTRKSRVNDVDRHVGGRIRKRRRTAGISQQQLAELIGVTYQQLHKYERAINRVTAGRLHHLAMALGVEVSYFYEELGSAPVESVQQRYSTRLCRDFLQIRSRKEQEAITALARALAGGK